MFYVLISTLCIIGKYIHCKLPLNKQVICICFGYMGLQHMFCKVNILCCYKTQLKRLSTQKYFTKKIKNKIMITSASHTDIQNKCAI